MSNYSSVESNHANNAHPEHDFVVGIVNLDQNIHAFSREAANNRLHGEIHEGGKLSRFVKRIWKGNIARDFYLNRYTSDARDEIVETGNLYTGEEIVDTSRETMRQAITDRFTSEYDEVLRGGESRNEVEGSAKDALKQLISEYARGDLGEDSFQEEKYRLLNELRSSEGGIQSIKNANIYIDNIKEIADQVKARVDHAEGEEAIQALLDNIRIVEGEAKVGADTEVRKNAIDRIVEKSSSVFVNEAVVGTAAAVVVSAAKWASRSALGALSRGIIPGAATGVIAGLRENARFKEERILHSRDSALGRSAGNDQRREQISETLYETRSAKDIVDAISNIYDENDETLREDFHAVDFSDAVSLVGDGIARLRYSARHGLDLIRFSSIDVSEQERTALVLSLCRSKQELKQWFESADSDERDLITAESFDDYFDSLSSTSEALYQTDVEEKDQLFKKMKRAKIAKAVTAGVLFGSAIGTVAQEVSASYSDSTQGMIEKIWQETPDSPYAHETFLQGVFDHRDTSFTQQSTEIVNDGRTVTRTIIPLSGESKTVRIGSESKFTSDSSFAVHKNENGSLTIVTPDRTVLKGIKFGKDGQLTSESKEMLTKHHLSLDTSKIVTDNFVNKTTSVELQSYVSQHDETFNKVTRDGWYDNDTSLIDQNELDTQWGGVDESGVTESGDYAFNISHMTNDGSYHGGLKANWAELAGQKKLTMAISISKDSQSQAIMIPVNRDGSIIIKKDSPAAQAFTVDKGKAVFKGGYAEVSQIISTDNQGVDHIRPLSTVVGKNEVSSMIDTVQVNTPRSHFEYSLESTQPYTKLVEGPELFSSVVSEQTIGESPEILAPLIIPVTARESLKPWRKAEALASYYYGGNRLSDREQAQFQKELSPRLRRDPNAQLELGQEVRDFRKALRRREGRDYCENIDRSIDASAELSSINPDLRAIITIPVAAAQESDNIYKTLSLYAQQDKEAIDKSIVLLNINWLDTAMDNKEKTRKIEKTVQEVERARRDFPDLKIASFTREYNAKKVTETGGVIGYVAQDLINTALLSIEKGVRENSIAPDNEVVVVRHDADMQGMGRHLLRNFQKPLLDPGSDSVDIVKGTTRFDVARHQDYPGFGIIANFASSLMVMSASKDVQRIHTGGANFGVRASTLAAIGGLGKLEHTGAGSDDVRIGERITEARKPGSDAHNRQNGYGKNVGSYTSRNIRSSRVVSSRVLQIAGATIDTDATRLIPYYLKNQSFQAPWGDDKNGFSGGEGGYQPRASQFSDRKIDKETFADGSDSYAFIETNISKELSWNDEKLGIRALSLFFASSPGAYTLTYKKSDDDKKIPIFRLTKTGRTFIRNRIEREANGRFGAYGMRKMRQQYGRTSGVRQPATSMPPLVAPL